jgi:hypothetical protein
MSMGYLMRGFWGWWLWFLINTLFHRANGILNRADGAGPHFLLPNNCDCLVDALNGFHCIGTNKIT